MNTRVKKTARVSAIFSGSVLLLGFLGFLIVYSQQERFIFQRQRLAKDFKFSFEARDLFIKTVDGINLNALFFETKEPARGLVLYFHGNRHSLVRWGRNAGELTGRGYHVLMIDYRGYGKSEGDPSEQGLYLDAQAALTWAREHYGSLPLVYYGRSLGTGVATHLALNQMPSRLVLETPYDELKNVVPWYFRWFLHVIPLRHPFRNNERLSKITCPVLILQGTQDIIVPYESALRLKPLLKKGDSFILIEGGGHNNLRRFDDSRKALDEFL